MNIHQCEYFLKLAETKSLSKAAQELFISKQGLSRSIQSLEEELETALFNRTIYGTELSCTGEKIFPEMVAILENYNIISEKLKRAEKLQLRILFSYGFLLCISSELIFSFIEKNPSVQFSYTCCSDMEIEHKLLDENLDLAFCSNPVHLEQFHYYHLFTNYRCLVVHKEHPLAQKQFIDISDLRGIRIAVSAPDGYNDYSYLKEKCNACGFDPDIFPCYESNTLIQFAEEKRGVSLLISNLLHTAFSPNTRNIFFHDFESSSYNVNIITCKHAKPSKIVRDFICHARQYCQNALEQRQNYPFN